MKKTIANVTLFILGYTLTTLACMVVDIMANQIKWSSLATDYANFNISSIILSLIVVPIFLVLFPGGIGYCGLKVLQKALDERVSAWLVLKKGDIVQIFQDCQGQYKGYIVLTRFPFDAPNFVKLKFSRTQKVKQGFRYFWNGKNLISVVL